MPTRIKKVPFVQKAGGYPDQKSFQYAIAYSKIFEILRFLKYQKVLFVVNIQGNYRSIAELAVK